MLNNVDNLGTVIANATMLAASEILKSKGRSADDVAMDKLIDELRTQAKAAASRILDQGKVLLDSGRTGWLDTLLKVECAEAARKAVEVVL